jgi:N-acetyl-anhydromuramyl-L-alanine amidase AmpD
LERPRPGEMNRRAIQAELCNAGFAVDKLRVPKEERSDLIAHPGNPYKKLQWELYPDRQVETLLYLIALCVQTVPTLRFITGHEDVVNSHTISAKHGWPTNEEGRRLGGKVDPGPMFPWMRVTEFCGPLGISAIRYDFKSRSWVRR